MLKLQHYQKESIFISGLFFRVKIYDYGDRVIKFTRQCGDYTTFGLQLVFKESNINATMYMFDYKDTYKKAVRMFLGDTNEMILHSQDVFLKSIVQWIINRGTKNPEFP